MIVKNYVKLKAGEKLKALSSKKNELIKVNQEK